jgi:hypothetical protein
MGQSQSIRYTPHVPWLKDRALNIYTQFGEDGLIASVFQRIGETNRQCFEVGASDGFFFSNTLRLRELNWRALLIESDQQKAQVLKNRYGKDSICLHMTCSSLNEPLRDAGFVRDLDFGVIDIDGQDYYLWEDLTEFQPRVMLVEVSTRHSSEPPPERGGEGQAGIDAITALGKAKGYTLVAETFCNALFVDSSCL